MESTSLFCLPQISKISFNKLNVYTDLLDLENSLLDCLTSFLYKVNVKCSNLL